MHTYVREGFLTAEECEAVRALFPPPQPGTVEGASKVARRSHVSLLPPKSSQHITHAQVLLYDRMLSALVRANEFVGQFQISTIETLQLAEYRAGEQGMYDWHLDIGSANNTSRRKVSVSVQLSNPNDYDGGDLEIWGSNNRVREQGALIAFASYLPHRVTPVTRGVRRSLVAWAVGLHPYR
jgi:PKHD-type hydroxylase